MMSSNPFPLSVFPEEIQRIIRETNACLNFPEEFIASSIIYATSIGIGNSCKIEVKKEFIESAIMYLALIGRPGTNKSHPLTFALRPLVNRDNETYATFLKDLKAYNKEVALARKSKDKEREDELVRPTWEKFILSDFTPEALINVHSFNPRSIGVYVDELASWFKNFNRFSKGSEMEFWLMAWSNKPVSVDRKTSDPINIPSPHISVAGTLQKSLLNLLAQEGRTDNGFTDRILFAMPDNLKKTSWSEAELGDDIVMSYHNLINNLLGLPLVTDSNNQPVFNILKFSPEARERLFEWQKINTELYNSDLEDNIASIYPKLDMYVPRFALILQLLEWACTLDDAKKVEVGIDAVNGAIRLADYFLVEAIKVRDYIHASAYDQLPLIKRQVFEALQDNFKYGEGKEVAEKLGMAERTFIRFLKDTDFFIREKQGLYKKKL